MENSANIALALESLAPSGVSVGARIIRAGDEDALTTDELLPISRAVVKVRRQSGAARIVARSLLSNFGIVNAALPRTPSGAPRWPHGIVGSLAHDSEVAIAAVAERARFSSLGIDVEPPLPLDPDLVHLVATPLEREHTAGDLLQAHLLFCVKEAVYKAVYPLDGVLLDHHDVEVDFENFTVQVRSARTPRTLGFRAATTPRLLALVAIPA